MPVVPGKNETGMNTEMSTSDVAMTAPVTSAMALEVAWWGSLSPSVICRCTFSITTMASSTTRPVASVMPNRVSELIEKPKTLINAKVPTSETGIVTAGMMVARQSCRNRKMTTITMTIASPSVRTTSRMESPTTVVVSKAITYFMPGGKVFDTLARAALASRSTSSALALLSCCTPIPTVSIPLNFNWPP